MLQLSSASTVWVQVATAEASFVRHHRTSLIELSAVLQARNGAWPYAFESAAVYASWVLLVPGLMPALLRAAVRAEQAASGAQEHEYMSRW